MTNKIDPEVEAALAGGPLTVRIRLVAENTESLPTGRARAQAMKAAFASRAAPLLEALRLAGATDVQELWLVNAVSARLSADAIRTLAERDDVMSIELVKRSIVLHSKGTGHDEESRAQ